MLDEAQKSNYWYIPLQMGYTAKMNFTSCENM